MLTCSGYTPSNRHGSIHLAAVLLMLCLLLPPGGVAMADTSAPVEVTIGVLAYTGKPEAIDRWQPTADYLSEHNPGYHFRIEPLFLGELRRAFDANRLDFVLTQSLQFSELSRVGRIWPLASLVRRDGDRVVERLGSVVFAREDQGFDQLEELAGRRVAGVGPNALGGWLLGMQAVEDAGIDVEHDITPIFTGLPLGSVIDAVLDGRAHAGVVRSKYFQRHIEEFPESRLAPIGPAERHDFPYPSNTPLVPEWPFAATGKAPDGLPATVARQLTSLPADSAVIEAAGIALWQAPLDYSVIDRLRDKWMPEPLTAGEVVRDHWPLLALIVALVIGLFHWQSRRSTRRLQRQEDRLRRAFSGLHTGAVLLDAAGNILLANRAVAHFARSTFADEASLMGQSFCTAFALHIEGTETGSALGVLERAAEHDESAAMDGTIEREGHRLDVNLRVNRLEGTRDPQLLVSMLDVTELRSANALLSYRATHDRLTGLLNREALEDFLDRSVTNGERKREVPDTACLIWLDLDEFRLLNEIGTRQFGDRVLAALAGHFSLELPSDAMIARVGVDEFAIWMPLASQDNCIVAARNVLKTVHSFLMPGEHDHLRLKASVGVTRIDADDALAARRMDDAERACQSAQRQGGDRVVQYSGGDTELLERKSEVERYNSLRAAISSNRLSQAAQRITPIDPALPMHHELLLRIVGKDGRAAFPAEFIEIAEKHQAMTEVDRWVVRTSCEWIASQLDTPMTVSINLSAHSVQDPGMIPFIRETLLDTGADPGQIIFEVTETAAIRNLEQAERLIKALRRLGCRFSLDDFGGGFLSFDFLRRLEPDFVKIDGQLIRDMPDDPVASVIVSAIIEVSRVMSARTVAEWVETEDQYECVRGMGVDYVQGFLIHRPEPVSRR